MKSLVRVTAWERASPWRRVLGAFIRVGIWIVLFGVLIDILGPPISIFCTARWEARKLPGVRMTPQPLVDYSASDAPGRLLSYLGYEFEVPWNASFKEKAAPRGLVLLKFQSGQNVLFIVPDNDNQRGLLTEIVQDKSMHMNNLGPVFGELLNRSAYDQYAALLNTTPSSIRAFGPRSDANRGVALLTIKAVAMGPGLETGIFSFEFPGKRGFQVGDPRKSERVDLEVFGMGGHHIEIICETKKDGARLSQPELNRILKSLRVASRESTAAPLSHIAARQNQMIGPD